LSDLTFDFFDVGKNKWILQPPSWNARISSTSNRLLDVMVQ